MGRLRRVPREDGMLLCPRCETYKPLDEYGSDSSRWDGINSRCKSCHNQSSKESHAKAGPDKVRQWSRSRTPRKKGPAQAAWMRHNAGRVRVIARVGATLLRAIKSGAIIRQTTCEICGKEGAIEAAHNDYSKPLEVRWLCRYCHRQWDAQQPKTISLPAELTAYMKRGPKPRSTTEMG